MAKGVRIVTIVMAVALAAMMQMSCSDKKRTELKASHADSVIFAAGAKLDYERMLALADSFEVTGDISALDANRWRGV